MTEAWKTARALVRPNGSPNIHNVWPDADKVAGITKVKLGKDQGPLK